MRKTLTTVLLGLLIFGALAGTALAGDEGIIHIWSVKGNVTGASR